MEEININELIKDGAKVNITYYECESMDEAYQKLAPYRCLGSIRFVEHKSYKWLELTNGKIKMTAFLPSDY